LGFELKKDEIKSIFDDLDKDLNSEVTLEEFVKMMSPRMGDRDSREEIEKVFKLFDEDNTGYITFRNLKKICNDLGENLSVHNLIAGPPAPARVAASIRDQRRSIAFSERFAQASHPRCTVLLAHFPSTPSLLPSARTTRFRR